MAVNSSVGNVDKNHFRNLHFFLNVPPNEVYEDMVDLADNSYYKTQ